MTYLVLDTDFLIRVANDPIQKLDLRQLSKEFTIATIPEVVRELEGLKHHDERKTVRRASNALKVLNENTARITIQILPKMKSGDSEADVALVELAKDDDVIIATMDHSLLSRLERLHLPYLTLRADSPLMKTFSLPRSDAR